MKYLLLLIALVATAVTGRAANPSFDSFATNEFITTNRFIRLRLNPAQFDTNAATITLTNASAAELWTNEVNNLRPTVLQNTLTATNIVGTERLSAAGAFILRALQSWDLGVGLNDITAYTNSVLWITGVDADPTHSSLRLNSGNGQGHLLVIQNFSTNSGFTMRNGEALFASLPGSYQRLNGDWVTTNKGDSILLYNNGMSWSEIGRMSGDTNVMTGGWPTVNPTDGYIPYRSNATTFADSPWRVTDPATGDMAINTNVYLLTPTTYPRLQFFEGVDEYFRVYPHTAVGPVFMVSSDSVLTNGYLAEFRNAANTIGAIAAASGWTGTGEKLLSDDGTYKVSSTVPIVETLTNIYSTNIAAGFTDFYTVPVGKTARTPYVLTAAESTYTTWLYVKSGGVYYPVQSVSVSTNSFTSPITPQTRLFPAGDILAISNTVSVSALKCDIWTHDTVANFYEARLTAFTTGYDTLYTVPAGKIANGIAFPNPYKVSLSLGIANFSGGARAYYVYVVPPGGAVDENMAFKRNVSVANQAIANLLSVGSFTEGYSLVIKSDSAASGQMAYVTVTESAP